MSINIGRRLKNKSRHIYGLAEVLKCDIDILRKNIDDHNLVKSKESIQDVDETIEKLIITIEEVRYILNLNKNERPL